MFDWRGDGMEVGRPETEVGSRRKKSCFYEKAEVFLVPLSVLCGRKK
jgi:hypothetical protein